MIAEALMERRLAMRADLDVRAAEGAGLLEKAAPGVLIVIERNVRHRAEALGIVFEELPLVIHGSDEHEAAFATYHDICIKAPASVACRSILLELPERFVVAAPAVIVRSGSVRKT